MRKAHRTQTADVGGAAPKVAPSFSKQIEREYIQGSAIAPSFLDPTEGAVKFLTNTAIGAGGSAVDEIAEALNWKPKQAGFSLRAAMEGAAFVNEDGSVWQVVLSQAIGDDREKNPYKGSKRMPTGNGSRAFLPSVNREIRRAIASRYKCEVPPCGESFWDWVKAHPEIPIVLTEGGKKSLALLSRGYVAIALGGVNSGYSKAIPGVCPAKLIPDLLPFCGKGRRFVLAFDQDDAPHTRFRVQHALNKTAKLLEAEKCKVLIALWEPDEGKGIDDAIVQAGDGADVWLSATIDGAVTFEQWQRAERQARMMRLALLLDSNQVIPERETEGEYLPALPPLTPGQIHLIQCAKGGGKSTEISRIIRAKTGGFTIIFVPNNPLGRQIAKAAGLPHIHGHTKKDSDDTKRFWDLVRDRGGICLCVDSIGALLDCEWLMESVDLIIFDEVNQSLANIAQGGTTQKEQARVLESLAGLLKMVVDRGGAVIGAEAIIYQRSVEYLKSLCGTNAVRLFSHKRSEFAPWDVELFEGSLSGFIGQLFSALADDRKNIILMVSSQLWAEKLERYFTRVFRQPGMPSINIIRLDSKTNDRGAFKEFYDDPDRELEQGKPNLLICSPSVKSGVSIERYNFDEVWGIFTGLHPDLWAQMTHRFRLPVPRKLFIKPFIQPYGANERMCSSSNPVQAVQERLQANQKGFANLHGIDLEALIDAGHDAARLLEIESATAAFIAAESVSVGAQKTIAKDYFIHLLESDGHIITQSKCYKDPLIGEALASIHEELEREKAMLIADIEDDGTDPDEPTARLRTLQAQYAKPDRYDKSESPKAHLPSWIKELLPLKLKAIQQAPGINFDDPEICYQHLAKDYGRQWRGVELQALSENIDVAQSLEKAEVEGILTGRLKLPHKLPRKAMQAKLIELCGISALLDGECYSNLDPRAIAIKAAALQWSRDHQRKPNPDRNLQQAVA
jgi:hypothetical protein